MRRTALEEGAFRLRVVEDVCDLLAKLAPVAHPHAALGFLVVAAKELEHALGVAGAAGVLEQEGVEQVRLLFGQEPQLAPESHANQAASR